MGKQFFKFGNGSKTRYYYDSKNFRLIRLLTTRNTGQDILQDLNYTCDAVGNITEIVDNAQQNHYFSNAVIEPRGKYEYDALYRLTKATGRELNSLQMPGHDDFVNTIALPNTGSGAMQNYTQLFTYDALGNIQNMASLGKWNRDYFYNAADNKLLGHTQNTTEYTYDAHGNMLTMPHLSAMAWDFSNRLFSANNGTVTSYYNYDATGNRARKTIEKAGNIREERYYIGNYEVYRKFISETLNFERQSLHVSDGTKKFASLETKTIENGEQITNPVPVIRYQYDNHLGSACLELDESAAIISYEEYHPFGTTSYRSGSSETEVSLKRYKYVGKERDEETGLYYYGARYYAAWIARFVSVDQKKEYRNWINPYNYVQNNPVILIDPDGNLDDDLPTGNVVITYNQDQTDNINIPTKNENWDAIQVKSVKEANEKLEEYVKLYGGKVENLVFRSHGGGKGGKLMIGTKNYPQNNESTIANTQIGVDGKLINAVVEGFALTIIDMNAFTATEELIKLGEHVKPNGVIVFTGCGSGANSPEGYSIGKTLSNLKEYKNKDILMNQDNSIVNSMLDEPLTKNYKEGFIRFRNGKSYRTITPTNLQLNSKGDPISRPKHNE